MTYRSNLDGRTPPTATDDVNKGYGPQSKWTDKIHNRKYTCNDATNGAAIWTEDMADVTDAVSVADAGAVMDSDFSGDDGSMRKTGAGTYETIKSNMAASTAPTVNDDTEDGYAVGSRWFDTTSDKEYVCLDVTTGAAVWIETTASYSHPAAPPCRAATAAQTGHATAAQISKLDGIETGATKYPDAGEQAFLDADHTKLDGLVDVRAKLVFEDPVELTISAGVVTVTQTFHTIDTQNNDASDDLVTINGGEEGQFLIIRAHDGGRTVVLKHLSGNILISGGDFSMSDAYQIVILVHSSGYWMKVV